MPSLLVLGAIAALLSLLLTPLVRNTALALGLVDRPDCHRKFHKRPVPRVGGVAIALAYALTLVVFSCTPWAESTLAHLKVQLGGCLLGAMALTFAVGLLDDIFTLSPWQKIAGQIAAASLAYFGGVGIDTFGGNVLPGSVGYFVTVLWLVGCSNAVNLIDGLDGLAAGVGLFATLTTLVAALTHGNHELAIVTIPMAGCLLGFLRYNFNPASIFLGDCGSLLIGFSLGCFGVLWSQKSATMLGMTAPMMALAIPLLDTALAVTRRFLRSQPIFGADRGHIHHRLLDLGLTPRKVALSMYACCGLAAAASLLQNFNDRYTGLIIVVFCAGAWLGIQHLGYTEFDSAGRIFFKGRFRKIIDQEVRVAQLKQALENSQSVEEGWTALRHGAEGLGFAGVRAGLQESVYEHLQRPAADCWQLRVPLPEGQYMNLYWPFDAEEQPVSVTALAKMLADTFGGVLQRCQHRPAAPAPRPHAAAAVGARG